MAAGAGGNVRRLAWSWHWPQFDAVLRVDTRTAAILRGARQGWFQRERGGQLFADISGREGVWLTASPPHPADAAGHTWLELEAARCRAEIEHANQNGLRLIGYWHTHPQRIPRLSSKDHASFRTFADRYRDVLPNPVAVIVGTSTTDQGIRAWSIRPGGLIEATCSKRAHTVAFHLDDFEGA